MKILTKELLKEFEKQGDTSHQKSSKRKVIAKFFNPIGSGAWYAVDYIPETGIFFGFISLFSDSGKKGYFSIQKLNEDLRPFGLGAERDLHFKPGSYTLKQLIDGDRP